MTPTAETGVVAQVTAAVRRTFWKLATVVLAITLGVTMLGVIGRQEARFEASALVVANDLKIRPESLPRFAEVIFRGGSVAERATSGVGALPYEASELIPDRARLVPFENTVIMAVVGNARDPQLATDIANRVADDFVSELVKAGPGVGTFSVQDRARPPQDPVPRTSVATTVAVGLVAGFTLAAGLLALWLVVRRPVLTAAEAAKATGAPLLGVLALPRPRRGGGWPEPAPATAAVARRLFPDLAGMAALVAPPRGARERGTVAAMVARVLSHSSPAHLVTSNPALGTNDVDGVTVGADIPPDRAWTVAPVLVDGPSEYDLPLLAPPNGRLVVVVAEGTPAADVERLALQFVPEELAGVVFTHRRRRT